jgi:hypothetical protein
MCLIEARLSALGQLQPSLVMRNTSALPSSADETRHANDREGPQADNTARLGSRASPKPHDALKKQQMDGLKGLEARDHR